MAFELLTNPMAITGESPLWDPARDCVWWIDIQAQRLLRTTLDGTTAATPLPWQPGFVTHAESGRLVVGLENGLYLFEPETRKLERICEVEADRVTVRLNDGKPDAAGRLWFGSMDMTGQGCATGRLYRRDRDGSIQIVQENIVVPNAIAPSPDGCGVTFVDTPSRKLEYLASDKATGELVTRRTITEFGTGEHPDGACFDCHGNLWIALIGEGDIRQISLNGDELQRIPAPVTRPTMPCLGGFDGNHLFVTNQRRFLSHTQLSAQPFAGGLMAMQVAAQAGPLFKVAGL
ncbi:SMP-30/gluconolactonase/LRE family protein [Roseibium sp. MMSF_3544]|uniref:SMP-30/gluconolactonase/LRE family protein n=1 Tax=unclassified Roseibium TaxID=2629323 RepID=UPI00273F563F|nr:SMP-30/gluconolactonase/LRE family protein [Roseibium sp. MMSF_3544]